MKIKYMSKRMFTRIDLLCHEQEPNKESQVNNFFENAIRLQRVHFDRQTKDDN